MLQRGKAQRTRDVFQLSGGRASQVAFLTTRTSIRLIQRVEERELLTDLKRSS